MSRQLGKEKGQSTSEGSLGRGLVVLGGMKGTMGAEVSMWGGGVHDGNRDRG